MVAAGRRRRLPTLWVHADPWRGRESRRCTQDAAQHGKTLVWKRLDRAFIATCLSGATPEVAMAQLNGLSRVSKP